MQSRGKNYKITGYYHKVAFSADRLWSPKPTIDTLLFFTQKNHASVKKADTSLKRLPGLLLAEGLWNTMAQAIFITLRTAGIEAECIK